MDILLLIVWVFFSVVAGHIAAKKGLSEIGFIFLSLLLSPLIGILCALLAAKDNDTLNKKRLKNGTLKTCPFCAELIKKQAVVCRYCAKDLK